MIYLADTLLLGKNLMYNHATIHSYTISSPKQLAIMLVRDILLEAINNNILSEGIAETTKSNLRISHTAIETKKGDIIEAEFFSGVIKTNAYLWDFNNQGRKKYYSDWYESKIDPYSLVGKKYFKGLFINFLFYRLFCWLNLKYLANKIINRSNENQLVCSTVNAKCRGLLNYWKILPKDLESYII